MPKAQTIHPMGLAGLDKLRLSLKLKPCDTRSRSHWRKPMESTKETAALEMRIAWAKEHWGPFFSEMVLRETNLTLATQPRPNQVETPSEIIEPGISPLRNHCGLPDQPTSLGQPVPKQKPGIQN